MLEFCARHVNVVVPFDRSGSHVRQRADNHLGGGQKLAGQMTMRDDYSANQPARFNFRSKRVDYFHIRALSIYSLLEFPFRISGFTASASQPTHFKRRDNSMATITKR